MATQLGRPTREPLFFVKNYHDFEPLSHAILVFQQGTFGPIRPSCELVLTSGPDLCSRLFLVAPRYQSSSRLLEDSLGIITMGDRGRMMMMMMLLLLVLSYALMHWCHLLVPDWQRGNCKMFE